MAAGLQVIGPGPTDRTITAIRATGPDGVDRNITEGRVIGPDGVDRVFWQTVSPLSAIASPDPVSGTTFGTGTATTNATTVTPSGGTAPYTYAWTRVSYEASVAPSITSAAAASTTFTQTGIGTGESYGAVFRCTVTDANGLTATADVSAIWSDTA